MISPHPSTTQKVAEDARRERLTRLAAAHQYPAAPALIWERFRAGPVVRWLRLEFRARRPKTPEPRQEPVTSVAETTAPTLPEG